MGQLKSALKWLLLLLPLLLLGLLWQGQLSTELALLLGSGLELFVLLVAGWQVAKAYRNYRQNRTQGFNPTAALEAVLTSFLPAPLARFMAVEPRIWFALYHWLRRRPLQAGEFSYHKRSLLGTMLWLVVLGAPAELFAYELLIPWAWLRWLLLIVSIYGTVWIVGLYASLRTLPHRLEAEGLRLRYGVLAEGYIPLAAISHVQQEKHTSPKGGEGLAVDTAKQAAYLAIAGRTNLSLHLRQPVIFNGLLKPSAAVTTVYLMADEPTALLAALQQGQPTHEPVSSASQSNLTA